MAGTWEQRRRVNTNNNKQIAIRWPMSCIEFFCILSLLILGECMKFISQPCDADGFHRHNTILFVLTVGFNLCLSCSNKDEKHFIYRLRYKCALPGFKGTVV